MHRLILLACCLFILGMPFLLHDAPLGSDIYALAAAAHEMALGKQLYVHYWDPQLPVILTIYALADQLLGYGHLAIFFLRSAVSILTLFFIYAITKIISQKANTPLWAAIFWSVACTDLLTTVLSPGPNTFFNLFFLGGLFLFSKHVENNRKKIWALLAGIFLGTAILFKPIGFLALLGLCAVHVFYASKVSSPQTMKRIGLVIGASCLPWIFLAIYFILTKRSEDFFLALRFNRYETGNVWLNLFEGLKLAHLFHRDLAFLLPLFLLIPTALLTDFRKPSHSTKEAIIRRRNRAYLWVSMLSIVFMIASQKKPLPSDYFLWGPLVCILAAYSLEKISRLATWKQINFEKRAQVFGLLVCTIMVLFLLADYFVEERSAWYRHHRHQIQTLQIAAQQIKQILDPGEKFFFYGSAPSFYFYTQQSPPGGVFQSYYFTGGPIAAHLYALVFKKLQRVTPELVVLNPKNNNNNFHVIYRWIEKNYSLIPNFYPSQKKFRFFYRKGGKLEKRLFHEKIY